MGKLTHFLTDPCYRKKTNPDLHQSQENSGESGVDVSTPVHAVETPQSPPRGDAPGQKLRERTQPITAACSVSARREVLPSNAAVTTTIRFRFDGRSTAYREGQRGYTVT